MNEQDLDLIFIQEYSTVQNMGVRAPYLFLRGALRIRNKKLGIDGVNPLSRPDRSVNLFPIDTQHNCQC